MLKLLLQCAKSHSKIRSSIFGGTLLALFCLLLSAPLVGAENLPVELGSWKSVDQFVQTPPEEEEQEVEDVVPAKPVEAKQVQTPSLEGSAPAKVKGEAPSVVSSKPSDQASEILIDTTADGKDQKLIQKAIQTEKAGTPAKLREIDPVVFSNTFDGEGTPPNPLKVRLAGLPSVSVKPAQPDPIVRPKKKAVKKKDTTPQPKATQEACEALSAMQKRELSAIEKDRQTLSALQAAIKDLGLTNKLNFSQEKGSLLGSTKAASNQQSTPADAQKTQK